MAHKQRSKRKTNQGAVWRNTIRRINGENRKVRVRRLPNGNEQIQMLHPRIAKRKKSTSNRYKSRMTYNPPKVDFSKEEINGPSIQMKMRREIGPIRIKGVAGGIGLEGSYIGVQGQIYNVEGEFRLNQTGRPDLRDVKLKR